MADATPTAARERVLHVAEQLFSQRGYAAVTLRDIANALGMRQASLFYHAPGGKEQLFVEVMERGLERHRVGLAEAIAQAEPTLPAQLRAAARWLLSQPTINLTRMASSDLPSLAAEHQQLLNSLAFKALLAPLEQAASDAYERGEARWVRPQLMAAMFVMTVEALHDIPSYSGIAKHVHADDVIDMLLDGVLRK